MTHDVYIAKTRTNEHKHTDVLLYVNDGYGLDTWPFSAANAEQRGGRTKHIMYALIKYLSE